MTIWGYYRLVFERAWNCASERARRFGFWVTPGASVVLLLSWRFFPESLAPLLARFLPYAAILSLVFLLLNLLWMLLVRTPYELYREKADALDAAISVRMEAKTRTEIRDVLAVYLERGQILTQELERWHTTARGPNPSSINDYQVGMKTIEWIEYVEAYIIKELDHPHLLRFRNGAYFPSKESLGVERNKIAAGLKARCSNLLAIIEELSH